MPRLCVVHQRVFEVDADFFRVKIDVVDETGALVGHWTYAADGYAYQRLVGC